MSRSLAGTAQKRTHPLIALCGNPNSGKTTIFNALTGLNQRVANYPGVTVERTSGMLRSKKDGSVCEILDIPGTYSLAALSPDEKIAIDALSGEIDGQAPDLIVCVLDASNLERSLFFLMQVQQIEVPIVAALNMIDVAEQKGLRVDTDAISRELGLTVVEVQGNKGKGITELQDAVELAIGAKSHSTAPPMQDETVESALHTIIAANGSRLFSRAHYARVLFDSGSEQERDFLAQGGEAAKQALEAGRRILIERFGSLSTAESTPLIRRADEIAKRVVSRKPTTRKAISDRLDEILLNRIAGPIILLLILGLIFQSIFSWAQPFMELIDSFFAMTADLVGSWMPEGALRSLITDGLIGGVGAVIIFVPQIAFLFFFLAILEDTGYVTRAAFLVDRLFRFCGLSGRSLMPMLSSFACAIPGILATRTIEDRNQRFLTIMVAPLMTCSARLPVYAIMIAAFIPYRTYAGIFNLQGMVLAALYLLGVLVAVLAALVMKRFLFKTERGSFLIEMPTYKMPTIRSVLARVLNRTKAFVVNAGTIILAITIVIWAASYYPRSSEIEAQYDEAAVEASAGFVVADGEFEAALTTAESGLSETETAELDQISTTFEAAKSTGELDQAKGEVTAKYPHLGETVELMYQRRALGIGYNAQLDSLANAAAGAQIRNSFFGRLGRWIEPVFAPLGWDWRITLAALASFPAREVVVAVLGTTYNLGGEVDESSPSLVAKMRSAKWDHGPKLGLPVFTPAVALSIMVFFALCCQCGATVVTIKQETARWSYAIGTFLYMTILAYIGAMATYQVFTTLGW